MKVSVACVGRRKEKESAGPLPKIRLTEGESHDRSYLQF